MYLFWYVFFFYLPPPFRRKLSGNPNGHSINFENFKIMCVENKQRARDVKEMIYIKQKDDRLNAQTDTAFLSECYAAILK